jgi:hypothetical protein
LCALRLLYKLLIDVRDVFLTGRDYAANNGLLAESGNFGVVTPEDIYQIIQDMTECLNFDGKPGHFLRSGFDGSGIAGEDFGELDCQTEKARDARGQAQRIPSKRPKANSRLETYIADIWEAKQSTLRE